MTQLSVVYIVRSCWYTRFLVSISKTILYFQIGTWCLLNVIFPFPLSLVFGFTIPLSVSLNLTNYINGILCAIFVLFVTGLFYSIYCLKESLVMKMWQNFPFSRCKIFHILHIYVYVYTYMCGLNIFHLWLLQCYHEHGYPNTLKDPAFDHCGHIPRSKSAWN